MDVGKIQGPGPLDRDGGRTGKVDRDAAAGGRRGIDADVAQISESGRETQVAVEELAERLRHEPAARRAFVAEARARLESGALDRPEVYEAVARRLLG